MNHLAVQLTRGDVTFAVPAGVILAGLLTLFGVWLTLRSNRQLTREAREWNAQKEQYMSVADALTEYDNMLLHRQAVDAPLIHHNIRLSIARANVVATDDIRDKLTLFIQECMTFADHPEFENVQNPTTYTKEWSEAVIAQTAPLIGQLLRDFNYDLRKSRRKSHAK